MNITKIDDLQEAYDNSWYFIAGAGGDLTEWVQGYEDLLEKADIGKPTAWYQTSGAAINLLAGEGVAERDQFQLDLTCLLFPWDGMDMGKLALFKIQMQDRWFDDVIQNMRR